MFLAWSRSRVLGIFTCLSRATNHLLRQVGFLGINTRLAFASPGSPGEGGPPRGMAPLSLTRLPATGCRAPWLWLSPFEVPSPASHGISLSQGSPASL